MKTSQNTQTFQITLTEIAPDLDDPTRLELAFRLNVSPAYVRSTPHFADVTADDPAELDEFYAEIDDYDEFDTDYINYGLYVAARHSALYAIFSDDHSGDTFDDADHIIYTFGQPIYDFIAETCRLLNVPFCPNAD